MEKFWNQLTTGVEGVCGVRVARLSGDEGDSGPELSSNGLCTFEAELLN